MNINFKVIESRSRSQEQKVRLCVLFEGGLSSSERQSCIFRKFFYATGASLPTSIKSNFNAKFV